MGLEPLLLLSLIAAGLIVWFGIPILRMVAYQRNLYDHPADDRKIHKRYVSNLGGIALFGAFVVGFSASGYADQISGYPYFIVALTILFFTGLKDDISLLSPTTKLLTEITAGIAVTIGAGMQIDHFHGFLGIQELSSYVSVPLTLFTMIVVMNAYNLIDGIDGLAGGVGILAALFFGAGFFLSGQLAWTIFALFVILPLSVFLKYNTEPAKIFMGDSGSLTIGLLLSLLAIQFTGLSGLESYNSVFGNTSPIFAAVFLVLPLYDTIRVYIRRVAKGKSPFSPDKDHIHHLLLELGYSHKQSSILLYGSSLAVMCITVLFSFILDVHIVFPIFFVAIFTFMPTFGIKRRLLTKLGIDISQFVPASGVPTDISPPLQTKTKDNGAEYSTEEKDEGTIIS